MRRMLVLDAIKMEMHGCHGYISEDISELERRLKCTKLDLTGMQTRTRTQTCTLGVVDWWIIALA